MASEGPSRRGVVAGAFALAGAPGFVQGQVVAPPAPKILITTAAGDITVEVYPDKAPITAKNFLRYVTGRRFDGASFYRAVNTPGAPGTGFIQGGAQNDPKRVFPPIAHESTTTTGLKHGDGTLSMARGKPGSATGDFFVTVGPASYFDANPAAPGDNLGYAAFGQVVAGMDVVRAILAMPTNGFARNPAMKGQMLSPPVAILKARVVSA